jgi:type II secretory pathway component PulM
VTGGDRYVYRERCIVTGGEVAGILVAVFWAILVSFLAVVLVRLAQVLKQATRLVADVSEQAIPLLGEASATVRSAKTQLDRVDAIATDVQEVTSNASALSSTVATTFGGPLVKVAAFGYGVRQAMGRKQAQPQRTRRTVIVGRTVPSARRGGRRFRGGKA